MAVFFDMKCKHIVESINIKIIYKIEQTAHTVHGNIDCAHQEHNWRGLFSGHTTLLLSLSGRMFLLLISTFLRACSYGQLIAWFGAWLRREPAEVKAFIPRPHALTVTGSWLVQLHSRTVLFPRQYWDTDDKSKRLTFYFSVTAVSLS